MVKARLGTAIAAVFVAVSSIAITAPGALADDTSGSAGTTTLAPPIQQSLPPQVLNAKPAKVRKSYWLASQLAAYPWLDKIAESDPAIVAAICSRPGPAAILADHPHLDKIAQVDHYTCRRICRWRRAADVLVRSKYADIVIGLDPAGFVAAMDRDPVYARIISGHRQFNELIYNDPELGRQIAEHIR